MDEKGQKIFKIAVWAIIGVLVLVVMVRLIMGLVGFQMPGSKKGIPPIDQYEGLKKDELKDLKCDTEGVIAGKKETVTFYIEAITDKETIDLYEGDKQIATMTDDGKGSDTVKEDRVFSAKIKLKAKKGGEKHDYYAMLGDNKSDSVLIRSYEEPSEKKVKKAVKVMDDLTETEKNYAKDGVVPAEDREKAVNELFAVATKSAMEKGLVIDQIEKTPEGVAIRYDTGITYVYTLKSEDELAGDENTVLSIRTIEPYNNVGDEDINALPDIKGYADIILKGAENTRYDKWYKDNEVTLETLVSSFKKNSFIIYSGHGGLTFLNTSFLGTGEKATLKKQFTHQIDLVAGRLVVTNTDRFGVTYRFFDKYVKDLSGSFVWLEACHSGQDLDLLSCMIWKNAEVSYGYSDSVKVKYAKAIADTTFHKLCEPDSDGNYHMITRALFEAVKENGSDDNDETPATPVYMGNPNFRVRDLTKVKTEEAEKEDPEDVINKKKEDLTKEVEKKTDDAVNNIINSIVGGIQKAIEGALKSACDGCAEKAY